MADIRTKRRAIVSVPGILSGEPIVEGTRISVRSIVLYCQEYQSPERLVEALPTLRPEDVETAMQYYRAHREEINHHIAENNEGEDIPYDEIAMTCDKEIT